MKEQSHKDEMSAAIRGDFQRLRARGVAPALVPQPEPPPEPVEPAGPEEVEHPPPPTSDGRDSVERRTWRSRLTGR